MWINAEQIIDSAIHTYRESLLNSCPHHVVIDNLFDETKLGDLMNVLQQSQSWHTQKHTYSALYVDNAQWQKTRKDQRFVKRDVWRREAANCNSVNPNADNPNTDNPNTVNSNIALDFLSFLRGDAFMSLLSRIFNVRLTDINVARPEINTNYFRLGAADFVEQHADDSPGREVCMLLYLNKEWPNNAGGELSFIGKNNEPISITPLYNRCVLFDPSSKGSEHWVEKLNAKYEGLYRYNVTSWYWSE